MIQDTKLRLRLQFLSRVVRKECFPLACTDQRLFDKPFSVERAKQLDSDPEQAERVEAFVGRLGRLQDTPGYELLPLILIALGETPATMIDNLDRAERLDLIKSADDGLTMRKQRNQMVHEYAEDPIVLSSALQTGHFFCARTYGCCRKNDYLS
ncbi:hypothetical protein [Propionivibrio sp.]|uniref:hypothetical protein n=1 Tax=Propionivibrio sp. TaxID=2212460 RepID=UPI0025E4D14B|nr:hypothetical protein [Propionivibrio sp.]